MSPWGSAIACTVRRSEQLLRGLQGFKGFKNKGVGLANGRLGPPLRVAKGLRVLMVFKSFRGLRAGKRQAWTPIRSH